MAAPKDMPVSETDELTVDGGAQQDTTRILGDFSETNAPLSENEIERHLVGKKRPTGDEWNTRTVDDTEQPAPVPED
jgi:hypothetical protein